MIEKYDFYIHYNNPIYAFYHTDRINIDMIIDRLHYFGILSKILLSLNKHFRKINEAFNTFAGQQVKCDLWFQSKHSSKLKGAGNHLRDPSIGCKSHVWNLEIRAAF